MLCSYHFFSYYQDVTIWLLGFQFCGLQFYCAVTVFGFRDTCDLIPRVLLRSFGGNVPPSPSNLLLPTLPPPPHHPLPPTIPFYCRPKYITFHNRFHTYRLKWLLSVPLFRPKRLKHHTPEDRGTYLYSVIYIGGYPRGLIENPFLALILQNTVNVTPIPHASRPQEEEG